MIAEGETPDVVILTDEAIDTLIGHGKLSHGRTDLARSFIGVAVRKGTPKPDISYRPRLHRHPAGGARDFPFASWAPAECTSKAVLKKLGLAEELSPEDQDL